MRLFVDISNFDTKIRMGKMATILLLLNGSGV